MTYYKTIGTFGASQVPTLYGSLGEIGSQSTPLTGSVSHALVPRLGPAVPLAQVRTREQAAAYAAGGFHASVDQALKWPATSNTYRAWAYAAALYKDAYGMASGLITGLLSLIGAAPSLDRVLAKLAEANRAADAAPRALQDQPAIAPPSPPALPPGASSSLAPPPPVAEPPSAISSMLPAGVQGAAMPLLAVGGFLLISKSKGGKKGKRKSGKRKGARKGRRKGRR